jgi:NAD-dependent dihydropyrimidine dehydrogenase PreA subunit
MSYIIERDICEGKSDCVEVCPVDCIFLGDGKNRIGTPFYYIDEEICISCGACLDACPVEGAVIPD